MEELAEVVRKRKVGKEVAVEVVRGVPLQKSYLFCYLGLYMVYKNGTVRTILTGWWCWLCDDDGHSVSISRWSEGGVC